MKKEGIIASIIDGVAETIGAIARQGREELTDRGWFGRNPDRGAASYFGKALGQGKNTNVTITDARQNNISVTDASQQNFSFSSGWAFREPAQERDGRDQGVER